MKNTCQYCDGTGMKNRTEKCPVCNRSGQQSSLSFCTHCHANLAVDEPHKKGCPNIQVHRGGNKDIKW